MIINLEIGIKEVNKELVKVNYRTAVRAIIIQNGNILMVHTNNGDYKFPGGGVNKEENHEETLKREVEEETGYIINKVKDKIGIIIERNMDECEKASVFEMTSYYYLCEVSDKVNLQNLDEYEAELGFHPMWININDAIYQNEELLKIEKGNNPWIFRETLVLKAIKDHLLA
jgi:8-oxo-dGTP pyrophosphatase MutT (NUDIX family)